MKYDLETLVNRKDKYSRKWDMMYKRKPDMDKDIPPFSVADYDFKYPDEIVEGFKAYTETMVFGYSKPNDTYYQSFINWVQRRHDFTLKQEWILDGNGVVAAICNSIKAFSEVNDGIIIMPPVYPPFAQSVHRNQRKLVECELINDDGYYKIDFDKLETLASQANNKILVMCSPHNPVGRVWTRAELERVSEITSKYNVLVVSDEVHMDVLLDDHKHTMYGDISAKALDNSIILTAASKSFNLAGARTSFIIIANKKRRESYSKYVAENCHISLNAFGFKLYEIAYNQAEAWFDEFLNVVSNNYTLLTEYTSKHISKVKVMPMEGTYLAWLDFRELELSEAALFDFLVDDCQIFINKGSDYGGCAKGFVRMNIALPTWTIKAALERLESGINNLTK